MRIRPRTVVVVFTALMFFTGFAAAQGTPQLPHIVDGEDVQVEGGPFDSDGEPYEGTVVADDGASDPVSVEDGSFEDLLVTDLDSGDEFGLVLGSVSAGSDGLPIEFSSGETTTVEELITVEVDELDADLSVSSSEVEVDEDVEFDFTGSGSTGVVSYELDFDDGTTEIFEDSGSFDRGFSDSGSYDVSLTVYDEVDNSASDTVTIDVGVEEDSPSDGELPEDDTGEEQEEDEETEEEQQDGEEEDEQEDEEVEFDREVNATFDEESNEASSESESSEGERVRTNIPESVDSDGSRVESIDVTSSSSQTIRKSVREVDDDSELQEQGIERREDQISVEEINVEGEVEDATITFSVSKDRMSERDGSLEDVVKERFDVEEGEWHELETRHLEELDDRHRFEADVPEFSYFATTIKTGEEGFPLSYLGILAVLLGALAFIAYNHREVLESLKEIQIDQSTEEDSSEYSFSEDKSLEADDVEIVDSEEEMASDERVEEVFDEAAEALREAVDDIDRAEEIVEEALDKGSSSDEIEGLIGDVIEEEEDALKLLDHIERINEE